MNEKEQMLLFIKDALDEASEGCNKKEIAERLARCIDSWALTYEITARRTGRRITLASDS